LGVGVGCVGLEYDVVVVWVFESCALLVVCIVSEFGVCGVEYVVIDWMLFA